MNYGLILAGGVGQRMRTSGMPKQFLEVFGKPIIIYTLEKFEKCSEIDKVVIACNASWIDHMEDLIRKFQLSKIIDVVSGGRNRQSSIQNGLNRIEAQGGQPDDIIVIHDGVRPLVEISILSENIRVAKKYDSAMTVKPVIESVVITDQETASFSDFKKRDDTYSLTSPQTFKYSVLKEIYKSKKDEQPIPLLDSALVYTYLGNDIPIIKENSPNIKITTPEDYYILKAMLELEENKYVFGI